MNKMAVAAALSFGLLPATAQGQTVRAPAGVRAEYVVGYDTTHVDGVSARANGATVGLRAGYDVPLAPGLTLGLDGEIDTPSSEGSDSLIIPVGVGVPIVAVSPTLSLPPRIITRTASLHRTLTGGVRVTWWPSSRTALYATGAYANQRAEICVDTPGQACGATPVAPGLLTVLSTRQIADFDGYRVGGGAQYRMGRFWFISAEYRYSHYSGGISGSQVVAGIGLRL